MSSEEVPFPPPGFDELSIHEQMEYVGKLGDRIPPLLMTAFLILI